MKKLIGIMIGLLVVWWLLNNFTEKIGVPVSLVLIQNVEDYTDPSPSWLPQFKMKTEKLATRYGIPTEITPDTTKNPEKWLEGLGNFTTKWPQYSAMLTTFVSDENNLLSLGIVLGVIAIGFLLWRGEFVSWLGSILNPLKSRANAMNALGVLIVARIFYLLIFKWKVDVFLQACQPLIYLMALIAILYFGFNYVKSNPEALKMLLGIVGFATVFLIVVGFAVGNQMVSDIKLTIPTKFLAYVFTDLTSSWGGNTWELFGWFVALPITIMVGQYGKRGFDPKKNPYLSNKYFNNKHMKKIGDKR